MKEREERERRSVLTLCAGVLIRAITALFFSITLQARVQTAAIGTRKLIRLAGLPTHFRCTHTQIYGHRETDKHRNTQP